MTCDRPDPRHNREEDSPEALRRSIESLAQAIAELDRRFDEATLRLDGEVGGARATTRRLATEVGLMGEALIRRMDAERTGANHVKRRGMTMWPLALAFTLGLIFAMASLLIFSR
jgi:hypothetical protein